MSRIYKFRAWDLQGNKMYPAQGDDFAVAFGGSLIGFDKTTKKGYLTVHNSTYVPMQFTGLLDKNGTEIYEGDICLYDGLPGATNGLPIVWSNGGFFLQGRMATDTKMLSQTTPSRDFEVIGNIYSDPNILLEESDD